MIDHMNKDHVEAMMKYCADEKVETGEHKPEMASIDTEGFHLRVGDRIIRFTFTEPVNTAEDVRRRLVTMVHD